MVVVLKKNGKFIIFVDFKKLNATIKKDPYMLPFINEVINIVIGHEFYCFLDGFSKLDFHCTWRLIQNRLCYWLGGFCMGCNTFWVKKWTTYLSKGSHQSFLWIHWLFMNIFLDDFIAFNNLSTHLEKIVKCFLKCK